MMSERTTDELTLTALRMALQQHQPDAGLIRHSDQSSQYTSDAYQALLEDHGFQVSMNGVGVFCYIKVFYNRRRLHSALDYLSPEEYERIYLQQQSCSTPCPQN